jgi:hypothetical protein
VIDDVLLRVAESGIAENVVENLLCGKRWHVSPHR